MKIHLALIVMLAALLTGCSTFEHHKTDNRQPPVSLNLQDALNVKIIKGKPVVFDEKGVQISEAVKMPIDISTLKSIESIQELLIITMKGSCDVLIASGGDYVMVRLPDGHPYCRYAVR
jgi:hypothetical protein